MATVYHSKVDTWLVLILGIAVVASFFAAFEMLSAAAPGEGMGAGVVAIIGAGLPLWLLFSTRYVLEKGYLIVQSGPFKWRIPVADITSITPTRNPISSPALSLDRLRIDYGRGNSLMISPHNKDQFIRDIEAVRRSMA